MRHNAIITLAALGLLTGCMGGPSATQSVTKSSERSGGLFGLAKKDAVSVTSPDAFKGVNQVVVGNFAIGFATYKTDSVKAGGGLMGSGFGGKSTAKSTLNGIDNATMQKITDTAYADFVSSLKAKGYTVVDRAQLMASPDFAKTKSYPSPYEDSSGGLFGASSRTKYFAPSAMGSLRPFLGDIPGMTAFGFSNPSIGAAKFAKDSGIKVLNVSYVLDFANAESYGGWHTNSSAVKVGQGVTIVPEYSKLGLTGGDAGTFSTANGSISLGQPITSMREFATVTDTTTGADKGIQMATNVIGALGGIGTNAKRDYVFDARPSDYSAAAKDALSQANGSLLNTMANLK